MDSVSVSGVIAGNGSGQSPAVCGGGGAKSVIEQKSCLESLSEAAVSGASTCIPVGNPCQSGVRTNGSKNQNTSGPALNFNVDLSSGAASVPRPSVVVKEFTVTGNKLTLVDEDNSQNVVDKDISNTPKLDGTDFDLESSSSYSDDYGEDEDPVIGTCLHCQAPPPSACSNSPGIQVSCDGCHAFICSNCHWCHEYQANHEVRVCDRCDGFYCKACDEMDQCEDCGEVVCGGCGSLCSCKFCGCGLCEECATSCGR